MKYIILGSAILIALIILIIATRRRDRGAQGEKIVKAELEKLHLSPKTLFHDYYLIPHENASVQIDHILVCKKGVVVIETKNLSGEIYGNEADENWKQVLARGRITHEHYNPVKQNKTHVRMLSKAVGRNVKYTPFVVFVQNNTDHVSAPEAIRLSDLNTKINDLPDVMGKSAVKEIADILKDLNARGRVSHRKHFKNIKKRHKRR